MHNSHLIRANRWQLAAMRNIPVVLCSEFLRSELNAALPHRFQSTSVIYNGADDTKFYPEQRSDTRVPQVIFTGRLVPYKGAHVLLEAMRTLQHRGVAAACKIVGGSNFGDNSRRTGYVKKLAQMMPANTELAGYYSGNGFASLLRGADIFCSPSHLERPISIGAAGGNGIWTTGSWLHAPEVSRKRWPTGEESSWRPITPRLWRTPYGFY